MGMLARGALLVVAALSTDFSFQLIVHGAMFVATALYLPWRHKEANLLDLSILLIIFFTFMCVPSGADIVSEPSLEFWVAVLSTCFLVAAVGSVGAAFSRKILTQKQLKPIISADDLGNVLIDLTRVDMDVQ